MKSMDTFLILLSVMLTFSLNLTAQVLPRNPTVSDISSFKDDISVRKKNVPRDQAEILDERRWLTTASTQIRELKNNYENNEKPDLDKFKNELIGLVEEIIEIDCNNLAQSKEELERILFKYQSLRRHRKIIDYWEEPEEWTSISQTFNKIYVYSPMNSSGNTTSLTSTECEKLKSTFSKAQLKEDIDKFITITKEKVDEKFEENADKLDMLILANEEIQLYKQILTDALKKANTKKSLESNLYLMILIIGLLSIATIGLVRLFPIEVMREWVESGQVIQFVTVMILLSVIMALGLGGLLSENTLGTLLGGIGGYVLSQGVGRSAARAALKEKQLLEKKNENK